MFNLKSLPLRIGYVTKPGAGSDGGSVGSTPYLCWKMVGSFLRGREFFFGKIRHNKQKLSINLTSFPFIFDQMFTNSSFQSLFQHNLKGFILSHIYYVTSGSIHMKMSPKQTRMQHNIQHYPETSKNIGYGRYRSRFQITIQCKSLINILFMSEESVFKM